MRDVVRFVLNGRLVEVRNPDPMRTLLQWLREDRRLIGTKEGCAEGDCGACTIMLLERGARGVRAQPINACILLLPMIDGRVLVTVEGLAGGHPVQAALVARHGSQCGFCTPGFVMTLAAHHANAGPCDVAALNDALAGNLCRCTGYGPILAAASDAAGEPFEVESFFPAESLEADEPLALTWREGRGRFRRYFAPRTLAAACALARRYPNAALLAGATDVGLWVTKQGRVLETVIALNRVAELRAWRDTGDALEFGAGVTYAEALAPLGGMHPTIRALLGRLGAAQVRASGTLGGNIANGSPIADTPPFLIALGAEIVLRRGEAERSVRLEDFFLDYGRQDRAAGEILVRVRVPKPPADAHFAAYKISKRFDQDIAAACAGFLVRLAGGRIVEARLAFGGMAGTPKRAARAEAALVGQPWSKAAIAAAQRALAQDYAPITDARASAGYRTRVAQNLLMRFYLENAGERRETPLRDLESLADG